MGTPDPYLEGVLSCTLEDEADISTEQQQAAKEALLAQASLMTGGGPSADDSGSSAGWRKRLKDAWTWVLNCVSWPVGAVWMVDTLVNVQLIALPIYLH